VILGDRAENTFKITKKDCMDVEEIAESSMALIEQKSTCWSHEVDIDLIKSF